MDYLSGMLSQVLNFMSDSPILTFAIVYLRCCCVEISCKAIFGGKCRKCKNYERKEKSQ